MCFEENTNRFEILGEAQGFSVLQLQDVLTLDKPNPLPSPSVGIHLHFPARVNHLLV